MNMWVNFLMATVMFIAIVGSSSVECSSSDARKMVQQFLSTDVNDMKIKVDTENQLQDAIEEEEYDYLKCLQQFSDLTNAYDASELWAIKVLDSWGKPQSGILSGNFIELGNFDECFAAEKVLEPDNKFKSQYCLAEVTLELNGSLNIFDQRTFERDAKTGKKLDNIHFPMSEFIRMPPPTPNKAPSLRYGICGPATCSPDMLSMFLNSLIQGANISFIGNATIVPFTCQVKGMVLRIDDIVGFGFFGLVAIVMAVSTLYDIIQTKMDNKKNQALIAFSVYSNGQKLFACKRNRSPDVINCLHGIRAMSMCWIIFGHTFTMMTYTPLTNMLDLINELLPKYRIMLVLSSVISVDTFFFMSGLLLSWLMLKQLNKKKGKINYALLYVHRYLRLTPLLAVCIFIAIAIFKHLGSGPFWKLYNGIGIENNCRNYWWSALLYIQNYYNPTEMCVGHSWYLSVDMQLFVASPPFIYLLYRYKHKAVPILVILCIASVCITIWMFVEHGFNGRLIDVDGEQNRSSLQVLTYYTTHTRMGAYIIGVLFGYLLYCLNGRNIIVPKSIILFGWIASLATINAVIFLNHPLQQVDTKISPLVYGLYDSLTRVAWPMALSFIIFACHFDYGGPVNWFLSLPLWQPISRLTYAMYLLHLPVMLLVVGQTRTSAAASELNAFHQFLGYLCLTLIVSTFCSLAFESPIVVFEKLLFQKKKAAVNGNQEETSKSEEILVFPSNESISVSTNTTHTHIHHKNLV